MRVGAAIGAKGDYLERAEELVARKVDVLVIDTAHGHSGGVMQAVRAHFRPEFLNRLDEIILFHRLTRANMDKIVDIQMGRLSKLLAYRGLERVPIETAEAGDIIVVAGLTQTNVAGRAMTGCWRPAVSAFTRSAT